MLYLSLIVLVVATSYEPETYMSMDHLRGIASVASCAIMLKMFDWLRLFEGTAFYILLIEKTIADIKSFMILMVIILAVFGIPVRVLDKFRTKEEHIMDESIDLWPFGTLMN